MSIRKYTFKDPLVEDALTNLGFASDEDIDPILSRGFDANGQMTFTKGAITISFDKSQFLAVKELEEYEEHEWKPYPIVIPKNRKALYAVVTRSTESACDNYVSYDLFDGYIANYWDQVNVIAFIELPAYDLSNSRTNQTSGD